ncbi:uncharacterized protein BXZ73DRAFT_87095 [Epithele typhae]|uniref:uncharacterized protein n=1 Tax=Epithele typhae TaxID=378194 RepID=UPI002007338C|nr:uncharacterized protein BXZ73DRAFT_87095 [Epithele typhae]KAH9944134.1 hypothetical protein BXZ73DRAFT_87095 [Epithele typhae]
MVVSATYTPHIEREDPFSLAGFFPSPFYAPALEAAPRAHEWDWLRASTDDDDVPIEYLSGRVSPISSDDDWSVHTPSPHDLEDAFSRVNDFEEETIKREDKLGVLEFSSDTLFLASRRPEPYVDDRLLSPYTQPGDPLDADAVYDALRALRTAHSLPKGSAAGHWGALVSWGVSRVVDYLSPV